MGVERSEHAKLKTLKDLHLYWKSRQLEDALR